jgi:long-chain acyl-CoA synthetase
MNLADLMTTAADRHGGRTAIRQDGVSLSYDALERATGRVAALLREHDVGPGDRVGVMLPNVACFPVCYYGALRAGAAIVPMNMLLKEREVAYYMADSGARVLFAWHTFAEAAKAGAHDTEVIVVEPGSFDAFLAGREPASTTDRSPDDTAVILYTSGTTGRPKGAELTHANLSENVAVSLELFELGPDAVMLGALPLFHAFGQTCALNATMAVGGSLSLLPRFDAGIALDIIARDRATVFEGVPTMYAAMLHHPEPADTSSLQLCVSGGAAMPVEVLHAFEEKFGCTVLEGYGLTETSPVAAFNRPGMRQPGTIGTPIEGVDMRLGPGGEILVRGHNVMKGYWRRPDETAAVLTDGGWLRTGDLGRVDADGAFSVVGRVSDLIIRDGHNIAPAEIEAVLCAHPAVLEAAVVGIADPIRGEEVLACAALRPRARAGEAELLAHLRASLAGDKQPRELWIVDELPKGPTGKVVKSAIAIPERIHLALAGARSAA